jgi:hypothetical protein
MARDGLRAKMRSAIQRAKQDRARVPSRERNSNAMSARSA